MRQVGSFLRVLKVSSTTKTDLHDIAEILLNTATLTLNFHQPENAFEFLFISF
jgi:hypothetical protein